MTVDASITPDAPETPPAAPAAAPAAPTGDPAKQVQKANKEAETLRLKLKEYEDRDKSEAERQTERVKAAEDRAAKAEAKALRADVAVEKGVPARFLTGETEDDLRASADEFLAEVARRTGQSPPAPVPPTSTAPVDQGMQPGAPKGDDDKSVEDFVAEFNKPRS